MLEIPRALLCFRTKGMSVFLLVLSVSRPLPPPPVSTSFIPNDMFHLYSGGCGSLVAEHAIGFLDTSKSKAVRCVCMFVRTCACAVRSWKNRIPLHHVCSSRASTLRPPSIPDTHCLSWSNSQRASSRSSSLHPAEEGRGRSTSADDRVYCIGGEFRPVQTQPAEFFRAEDGEAHAHGLLPSQHDPAGCGMGDSGNGRALVSQYDHNPPVLDAVYAASTSAFTSASASAANTPVKDTS